MGREPKKTDGDPKHTAPTDPIKKKKTAGTAQGPGAPEPEVREKDARRSAPAREPEKPASERPVSAEKTETAGDESAGQPEETVSGAATAAKGGGEKPSDAEPKKAGAEAGRPGGQTSNGKEGPADGRTISETDFLKIYLEQSVAQLKKARGDLDSVRGEKDAAEGRARKLQAGLESLEHEYDNFRRRTAEEKARLHDDAVAEVVKSLLPALDSLERAMEYADSNPKSFKEGVAMTLRQLSDGFRKLGVEEIEAESQPFDPGVHNAVAHVEDDRLGESVVADVLQKGYRIGKRVIRHAMVKVAN